MSKRKQNFSDFQIRMEHDEHLQKDGDHYILSKMIEFRGETSDILSE